ncbi:MAG: NAD(P)/FAD-dependent oxidoreductase [Candidatus Lokiarchaeota archaeon]|nr:NAD(P)/FAD-dependent oxidoreductase [Candidatus Lokiarchaeota archaeon]
MASNNSRNFDFVIVGAGPAGLTAGIVAARQGFKVGILEKGGQAGPKPRGEGMGHYDIVDDILGKDYLPSIGIKSNGGRVWHSPRNQQITTTFREYPHYFFEWRTFIDRFVERANEVGVEILLESEVIEPIEKNGFCAGVKYQEKSININEVYGKAIIDCSGYSGVIGRHYGVPYDEEINCPIVKCLISEANIDIKETPDLNFFFIGNGDLDHSPDFPPCVGYIFPLEGKRVEVGLMLRMAQVPQMRTVKIPTNDEIMMVWGNLKKSYPGFNEFFKGARIDYEEVTYLPNARMVKNFVPYPGVVLIGDSAGFVNPFGSSGLYYSMEMAQFWVKNIAKKMKEGENVWSSEKIEDYNTLFENYAVYKEVKGLYNLIGAFEYKIFNRLRTAEKINRKWDYISALLKQAS